MATSYERQYRFTTAGAAIQALDFPSRIEITRLAVREEGGTTPTVDLFNRAFTSDTVDILRIVDDGNTKALIQTKSDISRVLKLHDVVTIAGTAGYNSTTAVVTAVQGDDVVVIDTTYVADELDAGTIKLSIPAAQRGLWKIMAQKTLVGGDSLTFFDPPLPFINQDPKGRLGDVRKIYCSVSGAGIYRVVLSGVSSHLADI
jgi:hypothetical protein